MNYIFGNTDFKDFLFNRYVEKTSPKKLGIFRSLNQVHNKQICQKIKAANVLLQNLQELANSNYAAQIVNLQVSVQAGLLERREEGEREIQELRFASVNYFPKIKSANVNLAGELEQDSHTVRIECRELIHFRGMYFVNRSNIISLKIEGLGGNRNDPVNMNMENSNFQSICVQIEGFANVQIQNCSFWNCEGWTGLCCEDCNSLIVDKIKVQGGNVYISDVLNATMDKVEIFSNDDEGDDGCLLRNVPQFEINNAQIYNFEEGILFIYSNGEIKNSDIRGCYGHAVVLVTSQVKYGNIQYDHNREGNLHIDDESVFAPLN